MRFWENELPNQACYLPDGRKIHTDFVVDDRAWLCTDVGYVNRQIESAVALHIGGWVVSTDEKFQAALKKKASPPAHQNQRWFRKDPSLARQDRGGQGAVVARKGIDVPVQPRPDPIRVPTPEQMRPRKGPIPKEAII